LRGGHGDRALRAGQHGLRRCVPARHDDCGLFLGLPVSRHTGVVREQDRRRSIGDIALAEICPARGVLRLACLDPGGDVASNPDRRSTRAFRSLEWCQLLAGTPGADADDRAVRLLPGLCMVPQGGLLRRQRRRAVWRNRWSRLRRLMRLLLLDAWRYAYVRLWRFFRSLGNATIWLWRPSGVGSEGSMGGGGRGGGC